MQILDEATWQARARAHAARVDEFVAPHLARRQSSVKHPVHDFLFTYYSQRPAQLRRWHPGFGVALENGEPGKGYEVVSASVTPESRSHSHLVTRSHLLCQPDPHVEVAQAGPPTN